MSDFSVTMCMYVGYRVHMHTVRDAMEATDEKGRTSLMVSGEKEEEQAQEQEQEQKQKQKKEAT